MASLFGITTQDIVDKLTPAGGDYAFGIGTGKDMTTTAALALVEVMEDRVLARLPERYRNLMRRIDGEIAVRHAAAGQVNVQASVFPVAAGTLKIYVNYPRERAWVDRNDEYALGAEKFALTAATGAIALVDALSLGDRVILEYDHGAAATQFKWLREIVISYVAVEIARRFAYFRSVEGFERFEAWETNANLFLRDMAREQRPGVDLLERVTLIDETKPQGRDYSKLFG